MQDTHQSYSLPDAKFPTGQLVITPNALRHVGLEEVANALERHAAGDWGDVDEHVRQANEDALRDGSRLMSVYRKDDRKFWIMTEADRSYTTILMPEDY